MFQAEYGNHLPSPKFFPRWDNATSREIVPVNGRVDRLRRILGNSLYDDFMEANMLDLALYQHGHALLHKAAKRGNLIA